MPLTARDRKRLSGCDAALIAKLDAVFDEMGELGHRLMVTDGARTVSQQQALYAQGRTTRGKRVTDADGVRKKSNHQSGRAADCTFVVKGVPSWAESLPWTLLGEAVRRQGLRWGGDWKDSKGRPRPDRPHVELPRDVPSDDQ